MAEITKKCLRPGHLSTIPATACRPCPRSPAARLSVGKPQRMLEAAIAGAGLADMFEAVRSVDEAGTFKTAPQAYALVNSHMDVTPDAVSFQSLNRWDVAGAVRFGFRTK